MKNSSPRYVIVIKKGDFSFRYQSNLCCLSDRQNRENKQMYQGSNVSASECVTI